MHVRVAQAAELNGDFDVVGLGRAPGHRQRHQAAVLDTAPYAAAIRSPSGAADSAAGVVGGQDRAGKRRRYGASRSHTSTLPPQPEQFQSGRQPGRQAGPSAPCGVPGVLPVAHGPGRDRWTTRRRSPGKARAESRDFQCRDLMGGRDAGAAVHRRRRRRRRRPRPANRRRSSSAGRKRPPSSRFPVVGALTAPGMWPARGSTGSISPRYRSPARASSSTPCAAQSAAFGRVDHRHAAVGERHVARSRLSTGRSRAAIRPAARRPGRRRAGKRCRSRHCGASTRRGPPTCCRRRRRRPRCRLR